MDLFNKGGKKIDLNIISSTNTHGGFGNGMINLSNVSSIIIEDDKAYIDMGALHAKSAVEKGIKFLTNKADVPEGGKQCWLIWITADRGENGPYYAGATACEMLVNREARRGWKILADHVNRMDAAMKRRFMLSELGETEKAALKKLLQENNPQMWENSPQELKDALA